MQRSEIEENLGRKALDSAALHRGYFLGSHAQRIGTRAIGCAERSEAH